ncbi:hypothetical protein P5673_019008 [Acropora cervicornis]|uniref:Uncharacterized protein n=1 Tax=Acropora cervicornis TaxID=6130 RepID=A0AAD9QCN2_ACRCE|nr:hypothetical protein P5673_019008 [Acropora cervicornis]
MCFVIFWESGINNIRTSEVVPLGNQAGTKYKPKIDPSKLAAIEVHSYQCCSKEYGLSRNPDMLKKACHDVSAEPETVDLGSSVESHKYK